MSGDGSQTQVARAANREGLIRRELWRFAVPILWFGMVAAISFIEAPLKFQAPGITIPLGLGIGRLVFFALNLAEGMLLVSLLALCHLPSAARVAASRLRWVLALTIVFALKIAVVRPPLNARTDLVLAGADPGQSPWHYIYIAADLLTMCLLIVIAVQSGRAILASAVREPDISDQN